MSENDIIFHLGDIAASIRDREDSLIDIFKKLNGEKHLIRGNHDHKSNSWYIENLNFKEVSDWVILGDILLSHYPIRINEFSKKEEIDKIKMLEKIIEKNKIKHVIHGHVHQRTTDIPNHYNVSVEAIEYKPIEINSLIF